ncbi:MAG: hypothetical protein V4467_02475 [Patescibacteria group bacterium]
MFLFLCKCFLGLILAMLLLGVARTLFLEHSDNQAKFSAGKFPSVAPEGFFKGTVPGYSVSWKGKKFSAAESSGINLFDDGNGGQKERYPFVTSEGKGVHDKSLEVLKIDYNISANPLWLRPILDEIVEVSPEHFLGKVHVRIIPGFPFTLAFFELQK